MKFRFYLFPLSLLPPLLSFFPSFLPYLVSFSLFLFSFLQSVLCRLVFIIFPSLLPPFIFPSFLFPFLPPLVPSFLSLLQSILYSFVSVFLYSVSRFLSPFSHCLFFIHFPSFLFHPFMTSAFSFYPFKCLIPHLALFNSIVSSSILLRNFPSILPSFHYSNPLPYLYQLCTTPFQSFRIFLPAFPYLLNSLFSSFSFLFIFFQSIN